MEIYIKNVTASHERIENFLNELVGSGNWTLLKDTYIIKKDISDEDYASIIAFDRKLVSECQTILVKKNGL